MSEITVERDPHDAEHPFIMVSRKLIRDKDLSIGARGTLCYLLSFPNDWKFYHSKIQIDLNLGEHALNSILKELVLKGYAKRSRVKDKGHFQPYKYTFSESKKFLPDLISQTGPSSPENQALLSNESKDNDLTNKEKIYKKEKTEKPEKIPEGFKPFMQSYGDHVKLQPEKYEKFCLELGKEKIDSVIEDINNYVESSGRKPYDSYMGAIRTFLKKQKEKEALFKPKENPIIEECRAIVEKYKKEYPKDFSVDLYSRWVRDSYTDKELKFESFANKEAFFKAFYDLFLRRRNIEFKG